jgi:AcrR family transcriptional regulator
VKEAQVSERAETIDEAREEQRDRGEREGGRRRLAPEERRAEILDAALAVFAEFGFERATLQHVADRAGVTKGALYHYFESKDQLFIELVRDRLVTLVAANEARIAAADPSLSREDLLRGQLEQMWANLQEPHMLELSQLVMTELPNFPEIGRAFFDEVVSPSRETMRRILAREGDGAPRRVDEIEALVASLPSMVLGVLLAQRVFTAIDPVRLDADDVGRTVVRTLLHGALAVAEGGAAPRG